MEAINKKMRYNKTVSYKKNINPLYMNIEEYAIIMEKIYNMKQITIKIFIRFKKKYLKFMRK